MRRLPMRLARRRRRSRRRDRPAPLSLSHWQSWSDQFARASAGISSHAAVQYQPRATHWKKIMHAKAPHIRNHVLFIRNERAARRLRWAEGSQITLPEFLEQYPYAAREIAETTARAFGTAA